MVVGALIFKCMHESDICLYICMSFKQHLFTERLLNFLCIIGTPSVSRMLVSPSTDSPCANDTYSFSLEMQLVRSGHFDKVSTAASKALFFFFYYFFLLRNVHISVPFLQLLVVCMLHMLGNNIVIYFVIHCNTLL